MSHGRRDLTHGTGRPVEGGAAVTVAGAAATPAPCALGTGTAYVLQYGLIRDAGAAVAATHRHRNHRTEPGYADS